MCTYNISVDDSVLERVKPALPNDEAVEAWMQSQMGILLLRLADSLSLNTQSEDGLDSSAQHIALIHELHTPQSVPITNKTRIPDLYSAYSVPVPPIADYDLNARKAYYSFLRKNHFVNMQIIRLLFSAYSAGNMQLYLRIATEKRVCL